MHLSIRHITTYSFDRPISYALQRGRLKPKDSAGQTVLKWQMDIENGAHELEYDDQHNNHVSLFSVDAGAEYVRITCTGEVETADNHGITGKQGGYVPLWLFERETELTGITPAIRSFCSDIKTLLDEAEGDVAKLHALSREIVERVEFQTGMTTVRTTASEALEAGHGVCQDHAHIFISCARHLGYPARYVGGYLMMNDRVEQEAGHAWAEAHLDGLGWVGFDISNRISPDERYVRVATGLDYGDAAPLAGRLFGAADKSMDVKLEVKQLAL